MAAFTALAIGSLALSAYGQWKQGSAAKAAGQAQRRAAESQAEISDYNAAVADLQATDAVARGKEEENRFRTRVSGMIGEQRAGFAATNVDVGFGSAVDVTADAAFLGELDALTIRTNAGREAWGYKVQGEDLRRRGQVSRQEGVAFDEAGRRAQTAARIGAVGGAASGAANLLEQRYGFSKAGKAA